MTLAPGRNPLAAAAAGDRRVRADRANDLRRRQSESGQLGKQRHDRAAALEPTATLAGERAFVVVGHLVAN